MSAATSNLESPAAKPSTHLSFRPDIEGLRAVAVILVVVFHAGFPAVNGGFVGVDVFFVISGFLITGLLVKEVTHGGTVSIRNFYARRIRRLLPLSTVVLLATAFVSRFAYAPVDRAAIGGDIRASAMWMANWNFASSAVDYMSNSDKSPVLHYWSLSVEEQFYVVWPLLIILLASARFLPHASTAQRIVRMRIGLTLLAALSFVLSGLTSASSGPWAYFGLHTRAWELAFGGLVALTANYWRSIPERMAYALGMLGGLAILYSALMFTRDTVFPGTAALVPVVGACLVIAAGMRTRHGVAQILSVWPMTAIGRVSYGWYLWHWPCLILAGVWFPSSAENAELGIDSGPQVSVRIIAVVISFLLSVATYRLVEQPVRTSRVLNGSASVSIVSGLAMVATVVATTFLLLPNTDTAHVALSPGKARADTGAVPNCFITFESTNVDSKCIFGDPRGDKTVALIGDSHAAHWYSAMDAYAKAKHWKLLYWTKPACAIADVNLYTAVFKREYTECVTWRKNVFAALAKQPHLDAIVVGRSYSYLMSVRNSNGQVVSMAAGQKLWAEGSAASFDALSQLTDSVIVIREIPRPLGDVPTCISKNPNHIALCSYPRDGSHIHLDSAIYAAEHSVADPARVHFIDPTDIVCQSNPCSVVSKKGTIIFYDRHHLTGTFSRESAGALGALINKYVPSR